MRKALVLLLVFLILFCSPFYVLAKEPELASDYYVIGNNLVNKGQYEEALSAYQTARSMDDRFYNEHYGISYQIGWVLNKLGRYEEALGEFKSAEKYRPEYVAPFAIYHAEGCVLAKIGRNEEALRAFDSALVYQQTNWYVLYNKGIVFSRMGRYADAVTAFDTSRKAYGSYLPLLGSYQETAATYDLAQNLTQSVTDSPAPVNAGSPLSIAPDAYDKETSVDLLLRAGIDFLARYQYENALVVFNRILTIDSSNYKAMTWKGNALANLGRYSEAVEMYDKSLMYIDYRLHETYYVETQYQKAWVLAKQGKYDKAIQTYDKVFIINPDVFRAHYDKAWVLAKQGKYDEAVREYNRSLDWENQYRLEVQSHTILGPLGPYQEVMNAYDKTKNPQSFLSELSAQPSYDVVIYQTDFSEDPEWQTSSPRLYYWDEANKTYHFKSDPSPGYAEVDIPYNGTAFRLEYDITIPRADPGALVRFGLSQYNTSENIQRLMIRYNSQNVVMGEFKSWRAAEYRNIKDGDKSFQIYAINGRKIASDPEYGSACRINREESIAIPSFGENRIYHVVINFDPVTETITARVSDNLHEKTYYVCSEMLAKTGTFQSMDRLIVVAEPAANAGIEGSIDNVVLTVPAAPANMISPTCTTPAPEDSYGNIPPAPYTTTSVAATESISPVPSPTTGWDKKNSSLPSILTSPEALFPIILLIIIVIAIFIAADHLNMRKPK